MHWLLGCTQRIRSATNIHICDTESRSFKHATRQSLRSTRTISMLLGWLLLFPTVVSASEMRMQSDAYTPRGADTCLQCHDEDYDYPVLNIFYSKHGNRRDKRSPMARLQCESCHGPGAAHAAEPYVGEKRGPIISFGRQSSVSRDEQNNMCLACHRDGRRMHWESGAHNKQDMLCVDCHTLHTRQDPMLTPDKQADTCFTCHQQQRAQFERPSAHPVRQGKMRCGQCHNPHGTLANALLLGNTKNATCYRCHAEKRGPFLWAHAPVQEDCGLCHEHHGSSHTPLLKKRGPLLCQQCHSQAGHPSNIYGPAALAGNSPILLAKNCMNCHFQVHGSNHPSGVKLMR